MRLQTRLALLFGAVVTAAAALIGVLAYAAIAGRLASEVDSSLLEVSAPLAEELAEGRLSHDVAGDGDDRRGRSERGLLLPTRCWSPSRPRPRCYHRPWLRRLPRPRMPPR